MNEINSETHKMQDITGEKWKILPVILINVLGVAESFFVFSHYFINFNFALKFVDYKT